MHCIFIPEFIICFAIYDDKRSLISSSRVFHFLTGMLFAWAQLWRQFCYLANFRNAGQNRRDKMNVSIFSFPSSGSISRQSHPSSVTSSDPSPLQELKGVDNPTLSVDTSEIDSGLWVAPQKLLPFSDRLFPPLNVLPRPFPTFVVQTALPPTRNRILVYCIDLSGRPKINCLAYTNLEIFTSQQRKCVFLWKTIDHWRFRVNSDLGSKHNSSLEHFNYLWSV